MSSNAVPAARFYPSLFLLASLLAFPVAVAAQSDAAVTQDETSASAEDVGADAAQTEPASAANRFGNVNLSVTVPRNESDRAVAEKCEREAEAGKVAGEIVVCRQLGEASDGSWDSEKWKKEYAERTAFKGAPATPNTFGIPNHGNPIGFGKAPPPAIFIDVEALPEAPEGSDADRIARGLPPLGKDAELTPEEIAERRRALGLEAPPIATAPE